MTVTYPDSLVWVFNPVYITIEDAAEASLVVKVGQTPLSVQTYGGSAKVYISRLLQRQFTNPETSRFCRVRIQVGDEDERYISAVWGSIQIGDRFGAHGVFAADSGKHWYERTIHWFKHYPFTVDVILTNGCTLKYRKDNSSVYAEVFTANTDCMMNVKVSTDNRYNNAKGIVVFRQDGQEAAYGDSVFDVTHDYTFRTPADTTIITKIMVRDEKEGCYLRWVDRFGFIEYYLFDKGEVVHKTSRSNNYMVTDKSWQDGSNGGSFNNIIRYIKTSAGESIKVSASMVDERTVDYIKDVTASPIVDMYLGRTKSGAQIWVPVTINTGDFTLRKKPNTVLSDIELTVKLPDMTPQVL